MTEKKELQKERGWLNEQIEDSRKEVASWPDWMKKAAKFEGSGE